MYEKIVLSFFYFRQKERLHFTFYIIIRFRCDHIMQIAGYIIRFNNSESTIFIVILFGKLKVNAVDRSVAVCKSL